MYLIKSTGTGAFYVSQKKEPGLIGKIVTYNTDPKKAMKYKYKLDAMKTAKNLRGVVVIDEKEANEKQNVFEAPKIVVPEKPQYSTAGRRAKNPDRAYDA